MIQVSKNSHGYTCMLKCFNGITVTYVISSVGHSRLDSVGLLMMDGSVHIRDTDVVLQVPRDSTNLAWNELISWIDHMELNYDMISYYNIYYIYTASMMTLSNDKM
jgi:hypothetical protein